MGFFARATDILGINARNLEYLARYNPRKSRRFADDKLYTKHFLQARGLGVARLYASIRSRAQLRAFDPSTLPRRFVIKPNHGYGGEGIIVVVDTRGKIYTTAGGERLSWAAITKHCVSILDGQYAISGVRDTVLIEERLEADESFRRLVTNGLPDIRVIVFKYVPVIAMLRLPTEESHGKANLHLGAIGVGLDIATGRGTYGVRRNRPTSTLPNGDPLRSLRIPLWDDVLLTAAKTQQSTNIGYLAADIALTRSGIKVLELNARAGLEIQVCNRRYLRRDLQKLADLKVRTPRDGVQVGKTLFGTQSSPHRETPSTGKPVIGPREIVRIVNAGNQTVSARIDLHALENVLDQRIAVADREPVLRLRIRGRQLQVPYRTADLSSEPYALVLSGKYLGEFLIDVTASPDAGSHDGGSPTAEKVLRNVDRKLADLSDQIHLLARLKPQNLSEARERFLADPDRSPVFRYQHREGLIDALLTDLRKIPRNVTHLLGPLFEAKWVELERKLRLVEAVGSAEFAQRAADVYGTVHVDDLSAARAYLHDQPLLADESDVLSTKDILERLHAFLRRVKLTEWRIRVLAQATADMQVNKQRTLFIRQGARMTEHRFDALIAHEIETHVYRLENGHRQSYRLFAQGTAGYLETEEGIAVHNQKTLGISLGEKNRWPALNTIAVAYAADHSFAETYRFLREAHDVDGETAWRVCVRVKRGLGDTGAPGAFPKDRVYFAGYRLLQQFLHAHGSSALVSLYVGKIGIHDVETLSGVTLAPPKYLPRHGIDV